MSVEQLLFLVLFVLLPLLNMLRKALRKRRLPAPPVPEAGRAEPRPVRPAPMVLPPVPELARPPPRARTAERRPVQAAERRRTDFSPSHIRRGIVLMTILGPCRALEPEATPETRA
jgi:hypothetical protein